MACARRSGVQCLPTASASGFPGEPGADTATPTPITRATTLDEPISRASLPTVPTVLLPSPEG